MLVVPEHLNRNAKPVQNMAPPAETGRMLIEYMCRRIGLPSLAGKSLLDFGCGTRFSEAIINLGLPIGDYVGIDVSAPVISFLQENVIDQRFSYHRIDVSNKLYNPSGRVDKRVSSPVAGRRFDISCMFSVITHQNPEESKTTFDFIRCHIIPDGKLFFSAMIHDDEIEYYERDQQRPGLMSSYSFSYLSSIIKNSGWEVVSFEREHPTLPIQSSFLCRSI